eukprot:TRINITY_DN11862_c0_g1_i1.p1 TRINITY_DN11862_c0_g1~~TRINITY_DN11862_c0_g1_i1.p1  ORF type:complete len:323 (+),score=82.33 TRINITY_DN11862_c0_g1_i1:48-1016(+)
MPGSTDYAAWAKFKDEDDDDDDDPGTSEAKRALKRSLGRTSCVTPYDKETEQRNKAQKDVEAWFERECQKLFEKESARAAEIRKHNGGVDVDPVKDPSKGDHVNLSRSDRQVLGAICAVSEFQGPETTNLTRYPELVEIFKAHRWLDHDPGALELLCRLHAMHQPARPLHRGDVDSEEAVRFRNILVCAINTLAAAQLSGYDGGFLSLIDTLARAGTDEEKVYRRKWQMKEFADLALSHSARTVAVEDASIEFNQMKSKTNWQETLIMLLAGLMFMVMMYLKTTGMSPEERASAADVLPHVKAMRRAMELLGFPSQNRSAEL